jgi:hypothetical protein
MGLGLGRFEQLAVRADPMHDYRTTAHALDHQQIRSQMTLHETCPVDDSLL